jgi:hypothetical protein
MVRYAWTIWVATIAPVRGVMRTTGVNGVTGIRTRPPGDDARPGPGSTVQPVPEWRSPGERGELDIRSRAEVLEDLALRIRSGAYEPPLDDVAEQLAAFFVPDRPYLPRDLDDA